MLISTVIMTCNFLFLSVIYLSDFQTSMMVALQNEFGSFPLSETLWKFEQDRCQLLFKLLIEFTCEGIWPWPLVCWKILYYSFFLFVCVCVCGNYYLFIYFYQLEANYFTILQWVLSYIEMNQPWIYMCSPSQSPLPPPSPPHPIPLHLPSAPGPSACLMHPTQAGDLFHPR